MYNVHFYISEMESQQEVNPVFLQQLRELDIPEEAAKQVHITSQNTINLLTINEVACLCRIG